MKTYRVTIVDTVNGSVAYTVNNAYDVQDAIHRAKNRVTALGTILSISTTLL